MIDRSFVLSVLRFVANGFVVPPSSYQPQPVLTLPSQLIAVVKNNKVTVSQFTFTNVSVTDYIDPQGNEVTTVKMLGTDASNYSYTADSVEIWGATSSTLVYKIATIDLTTPLAKDDHDYFNLEYTLTVKSGTAFTYASAVASRYIDVVTFSTPVSMMNFFIALFSVPSLISVLRSNPTFPMSQLVKYVSPPNVNSIYNFDGISFMYANSTPVQILNKLVGYGLGIATLDVNGQVSSPVSSPFVTLGFSFNGYLIPLLAVQYSGDITNYVSVKVNVGYGPSTQVSLHETATTGSGRL